MRVLLIGAAGMIGSRVALEARTRGHVVTGVGRTGRDHIIGADASDPHALAALAADHDAIVLAARAMRTDVAPHDGLLAIGRAVTAAMRETGVERLVVVGGAGSLEVAPGVRFLDQALNLPDAIREEANAQAALLAFLRQTAGDLSWTYVSPGGMIAPGQRTGKFRIGGDQVLVDGGGKSFISAEDYAIGLVDELETAANVGRRINLGY
ncbi:putative NADH-flavin reductase [Caulobacter sp. AP07]|uniref:NAD(P)-dependent oxidoreductase n=1 Tax=Caulobacter sp. AP07 TaxID=1144304 RepID=UPI0002720C53|nr:NAD(P)H-binding protein [Caulobacter sp. AP07]EJL27328.1 putative NADH-flavin reductase [Caulobacter sp. AP07]